LAYVVKKIEDLRHVSVLRRDLFGEPYYYRLLTNGFSMSFTSPRNQRYMRLFAYLPVAFRPESEDVLLICYGCGVTADALLHDRTSARLMTADRAADSSNLCQNRISESNTSLKCPQSIRRRSVRGEAHRR